MKKFNPMLRAWNAYLSSVYAHTEISAVQHSECQQAFFAGYIEALSDNLDLFDYPPEDAKAVLKDRIDWLMKYHRDRISALEDGGF